MKKLILLSPNPDDKAFSLELAAQRGLEWDSVQSIAELESRFHGSALMLHISSLTEAAELKRILGDGHGERIHLLLDPESPLSSDIVETLGVRANLVTRRYGEPWKAARAYAKVLNAHETRARGLAKFGFAPRETQGLQISDPLQKGYAAAATREFLVESGCNDRMADLISSSVDEIIMNALLDAPLGRPATQAELKGSGKLPPESGKSVDFQIGITPDQYGFCVTDWFGTLNLVSALNFAARGFGPTHFVGAGGAGAGIGLSQVLKSGASLAFLNAPGQATEVTALYKRSTTVRDIKNQFQFVTFHVTSSLL